MANTKFSEIATTSSNFGSGDYLIGVSTIGSLHDTRFSLAQVAANITGTPGGTSSQIQINSSGTFGGISDTQLTARVVVFSSVLSGAVPASGGGSSTFLRADGTFAVPSGGTGTPGGANTEIQFNSSGTFAGSSNFVWNGSNILLANATMIDWSGDVAIYRSSDFEWRVNVGSRELLVGNEGGYVNLSFNKSNVFNNSMIGLQAENTGDFNLYYAVPSSGAHDWYTGGNVRFRVGSSAAVFIGPDNSSTVFRAYARIGGTVISLLPASSTVPGARATVVDSTVSSTGYGTLIQGGGSNIAPVYSDGSTAWRVG